MMRTLVSVALVAFAASTAAVGQCPSQGLQLVFQGERIGDPYACGVFGNPGAPGVLGVDAAGGPSQTPSGPVCLGLTPQLQLITFTLDSLGQFFITGTTSPYPPLIGFTAYLQAAAVDGGQPNGLAFSNGRKVVLRPPRIYFVDPGNASPFGVVPGRWSGFDALTDTSYTTAINLASSVQDVAVCKDLGLLVFLLSNGTIQCFDTTTAALVRTFPALTSPALPAKIAVDGTTLYAMHTGTPPSPFGGGSPGGIRSYDLNNGSPGIVVTLAAGNPDAMMLFPGTGFAYLRTGVSITPIDVVNATALSPIVLSSVATSGGIGDWVLANNILYCVFPGAQPGLFTTGAPALLNAVNTLNHTALFPDAVNMNVNGPVTMLRYGPGSTGNTLFAFIPSYPQPLIEVNPSSLLTIGPIAVSTGLSEMTLSPGGSEWLLLCTGPVCGASQQLQTLVPPAMTVNTISPLLYPMQLLISLPSATLRRAFMLHNYNTVVPFSTDFSGVPITTVPLPISSPAMRYAVD